MMSDYQIKAIPPSKLNATPPSYRLPFGPMVYSYPLLLALLTGIPVSVFYTAAEAQLNESENKNIAYFHNNH